MEDKKQQAISRGKRAELLLQDEMLTDAFARLEQGYIEHWKQTGVRDSDARERLFLAVNIIGKIKTHLHGVMVNGRIVQSEIDDLVKPPKRGIFG